MLSAKGLMKFFITFYNILQNNKPFEDLIRKLYDIPYTKRKNIEDNIKLLRKDLKSLINKSQNGDIVIKKG